MAMTSEEWRNHQFYEFDPFFGKIYPSLLNSMDIKNYIDKGCLIEEADFDVQRLKTASYEMRFLGQLYDWVISPGGKMQKRCREVYDGVEIELPANSITYLWMKEKIMLPEYIAARFNLHIAHVHKGILLGTGPLIDPGFFGSLLIPLHNLTDNDYKLKGGDGVIWVEFTKVSQNAFWSQSEKNQRPHYLRPFPVSKHLDNPDRYIEKSGIAKAGGVQSAFKGALDQARNNAQGAQRKVKSLRKLGVLGLLIGTLTILVSIGSLVYSGYNFISRTITLAQDSHSRLMDTSIRSNKEKIEYLEKKIYYLENKINNIW